MENIRALTLMIALTVLLPGAVFAYSRDTHKGLADTTLQAYENLRGATFTSPEKTALIQGTWDEDDDWRFMRHFYDPINNRGLFGDNPASKYWAQDTEGQGNYNCLNAWLCAGKHISYNDTLFSSPTDFSWDRAVYEYAWGDKVKGAAALGHILHLIQDATVPAHVRDDAHPSKWGIDIQADPYEKYSARYTQANILLPTSLTPSSVQGLSHAFDSVAMFTNTNFVSKDTMSGSFKSPDLMQIPVRDGYGYNALGYKVARISVRHQRIEGQIKEMREYHIDDNSDSVAADYWRVLSKKAIETSVGVIDLFFREVEKERKTGALKARNVSAAELHVKETARKGFNTVKALYGSSLEQSDVEELLGEGAGQAGAAALVVAKTPPAPEQNTASEKPTETVTAQVDPPQEQRDPQVLGVTVAPTEETPVQPSPVEDLPTPVEPSPTEVSTSAPSPSASSSGGSSGGSPTANPDTSVQAEVSSPLSLSILSPDENQIFATSSVAFTGTTSASALVTAAYDSVIATTTTDENGNWTFDLSLSSGTTTVSFSAATSTETTATSTRAVGVDAASPDAPDIAITECEASIVVGDCVVATTAVTVLWDAVPSAGYYEVFKDGVFLETTSGTSTVSSISTSATTTIFVVAHKSNGTSATSTSKTALAITQPLLINEIAWMGTDASADDEWIEVRNVSNFALDLSHFVITTSDSGRVIPLSGTLDVDGNLASSGFLLIERVAEATTVHSPQETITVDFAQLSDSGEQLLLQWGTGTATTTIDTTPAVATCGGWCAGTPTGSIGVSAQSATTTVVLTMERKDNSSDGSLAASWQTNDAYTFGYGSDRSSNFIYGTPAVQNSQGHPTVGWFCSPDTTSIISGEHYTPESSVCTYLMRAIKAGSNRYGIVFRGDVGSSTIAVGHFFGPPFMSQVLSDTISDPQAGEHFFIAIYQARTGPNFQNPSDSELFNTYFTTGAGAPPHSNYYVIPWIYGP